MKRSGVSINEIADWDNLCWAAWRAGRGKRNRDDVRIFFQSFDSNIQHVRKMLFSEQMPLGSSTQFTIYDPKRRRIKAPIFAERVLHHAIIAHVGPILDRCLVFDSFACRKGKGSHLAVKRVQHFVRRYPFFTKIDIQKYFPSINHLSLYDSLCRRFRNKPLLRLLWRIIDGHHDASGFGLPIGALTSQAFANFYLNRFDHWLASDGSTHAMIRYMDDVLWWHDQESDGAKMFMEAKSFLLQKLQLDVHRVICGRQSSRGVLFCGYRVFPDRICLGRRLRRRYRCAQVEASRLFEAGEISEYALQQRLAAIDSIVSHADQES